MDDSIAVPGVRELSEHDPERGRDMNVGSGERIASAVIGTGLALFGLSRRSLPGLLVAGVGGVLVRRGVTGYCAGYEKMGVRPDDATALSNPITRAIHGTRSILVNRPVDEVYRFWRDFQNLATVIPELSSVEDLGDGRSRWTAHGPRGTSLEWIARLVEDVPNRRVSWQSEDGSSLDNAGTVELREAPGGRGTLVRLEFRYRTRLGIIGAAIAKASRLSPFGQMEEGLRRMKQLLEAGEIATPEGPSGRRSKPVQRLVQRLRGPREAEFDEGEDFRTDQGFEGPLPTREIRPGIARGMRDRGLS